VDRRGTSSPYPAHGWLCARRCCGRIAGMLLYTCQPAACDPVAKSPVHFGVKLSVNKYAVLFFNVKNEKSKKVFFKN